MITLGGRTFNTKKALTAYVRLLLTNNIGNIINEQHDDFNFLKELTKRHPEATEKIGCGIDCFNIGYQPTLSITRKDGSIIDISWKTCISQKKKTHAAMLNDALRVAIRKQISDYELEHNICEECGADKDTYMGVHHLEVHHVIPFNILVKYFKLHNMHWTVFKEPTIFDNDALTNCARFTDDDSGYELAWRKYHKEHANLMTLCQACHKIIDYKPAKKENDFDGVYAE